MDSGGGMRALPPGGDERSERRTAKAKRRDRVGRTGTDVAWRTGTRVPLANRKRVDQGLTDSSSATEAGEDRLNHEKEPAASLCSLERVVRPGG